ncbi:Cys-loop ligand-gated ion channel [BD1-7 clade bacterium]|uniref:Cys-loop ligand-gated ion channel n=1 Tax=BD1-7 clade bacterium TaxID=2029982 RepID=A0A5S9QLB3_9GAMM|nr:Cys-loop ligand-gated ion channel [BD1-7 clade bacterium]
MVCGLFTVPRRASSCSLPALACSVLMFFLCQTIHASPAFYIDKLNEVDKKHLEASSACKKNRAPIDPMRSGRSHLKNVTVQTEYPVQAGVGVLLQNINAINEVENSFSVSGYLSVVWCDKSFAVSETPTSKLMYLEASAAKKLEGLWRPDLYFVNDTHRHMSENIELDIYNDGTMIYSEKFNVVISAVYDLHDFPFDKQLLKITLQSFSWDASQLILVSEPLFNGSVSGLSDPEWEIEDIRSDVYIKQDHGERAVFYEYDIEVDVQHRPGYFLLKVILPLFLLVSVSWVVFWTRRFDVRFRLGPLLTVMLTIVAFNFTISSALPKVNYMTFFDKLLSFSFITVYLAVAAILVISILHNRNWMRPAHIMNLHCRWIFPVIYIVGISWLVGSTL